MEQRLRALVEKAKSIGTIEDEDGEKIKIDIGPPIKDDQKRKFDRICRGNLPRELEGFLSITSGFHNVLEFKPEPLYLENDYIGTLKAYDYGNGDGLGLEPAGERCRVWWVGHDPWFIVYWADSIEKMIELWIERVEQLKSGTRSYQDLFWKPEHESEPVQLSDLVVPGEQELTLFLKTLPPGTILHDLRKAKAGTVIPFERAEEIARGGSVKRSGLVFAFLSPPKSTFVKPFPVSHYLSNTPTEDERRILETLPKGCLILHERDLPKGGKMDLDDADPEQDISWKPPFHVLYPKKKPRWKIW